jgi:hypothetical protein
VGAVGGLGETPKITYQFWQSDFYLCLTENFDGISKKKAEKFQEDGGRTRLIAAEQTLYQGRGSWGARRVHEPQK